MNDGTHRMPPFYMRRLRMVNDIVRGKTGGAMSFVSNHRKDENDKEKNASTPLFHLVLLVIRFHLSFGCSGKMIARTQCDIYGNVD